MGRRKSFSLSQYIYCFAVLLFLATSIQAEHQNPNYDKKDKGPNEPTATTKNRSVSGQTCDSDIPENFKSQIKPLFKDKGDVPNWIAKLYEQDRGKGATPALVKNITTKILEADSEHKESGLFVLETLQSYAFGLSKVVKDAIRDTVKLEVEKDLKQKYQNQRKYHSEPPGILEKDNSLRVLFLPTAIASAVEIEALAKHFENDDSMRTKINVLMESPPYIDWHPSALFGLLRMPKAVDTITKANGQTPQVFEARVNKLDREFSDKDLNKTLMDAAPTDDKDSHIQQNLKNAFYVTNKTIKIKAENKKLFDAIRQIQEREVTEKELIQEAANLIADYKGTQSTIWPRVAAFILNKNKVKCALHWDKEKSDLVQEVLQNRKGKDVVAKLGGFLEGSNAWSPVIDPAAGSEHIEPPKGVGKLTGVPKGLESVGSVKDSKKENLEIREGTAKGDEKVLPKNADETGKKLLDAINDHYIKTAATKKADAEKKLVEAHKKIEVSTFKDKTFTNAGVEFIESLKTYHTEGWKAVEGHLNNLKAHKLLDGDKADTLIRLNQLMHVENERGKLLTAFLGNPKIIENNKIDKWAIPAFLRESPSSFPDGNGLDDIAKRIANLKDNALRLELYQWLMNNRSGLDPQGKNVLYAMDAVLAGQFQAKKDDGVKAALEKRLAQADDDYKKTSVQDRLANRGEAARALDTRTIIRGAQGQPEVPAGYYGDKNNKLYLLGRDGTWFSHDPRLDQNTRNGPVKRFVDQDGKGFALYGRDVYYYDRKAHSESAVPIGRLDDDAGITFNQKNIDTLQGERGGWKGYPGTQAATTFDFTKADYITKDWGAAHNAFQKEDEAISGRQRNLASTNSPPPPANPPPSPTPSDEKRELSNVDESALGILQNSCTSCHANPNDKIAFGKFSIERELSDFVSSLEKKTPDPSFAEKLRKMRDAINRLNVSDFNKPLRMPPPPLRPQQFENSGDKKTVLDWIDETLRRLPIQSKNEILPERARGKDRFRWAWQKIGPYLKPDGGTHLCASYV